MKKPVIFLWAVLVYSTIGWNTLTFAETKVEDALARDMLTKTRERVIVLMRPDPDSPNGGQSISAPASYLQRVLGSNSTFVKQIGRLPAVSVELDVKGLKQLAKDPNVAKILRDVPMKPTLMDSVPLIEADVLHKAGYKGVAASVAILDTGVDPTHPALKDSIVAQACFSTPKSNVYKLQSGIRVRWDSWVSVVYSTELNSATSSVTPQRTDRHGILVRQVALKRKKYKYLRGYGGRESV